MIQSDTLHIDTIVSTGEYFKMDEPVFIGEERVEETNFPFSENLNLDLQPDWIFYFTFGVITLFAWLKLAHNKLTFDILASTINYQLSLRLFKNANVSQKRISNIYSSLYFLNFTIYLYLITDYFKYYPGGLRNISLIIAIFVFLIALSLLKMLNFTIIAKVFKQEKFFQEASFHNSLFNKLTGIAVLPFILIISYISEYYLNFLIYISLGVILLVNILRLFRLANFVFKNVVSYFYFILYLCALEILPLWVIIKLLNSL